MPVCAPQVFVGGRVFGDGGDVAPGQVEQLLADGEILVAPGDHDVANVVVPVRGHALVFGDHVAVQVEDAGHHAQAAQSGFFLRRAPGAARPVAAAVAVAPAVDPPTQLPGCVKQPAFT